MDADKPLNYFNYFTEVEETFVRRRGAHMLVSPLDWALIESWKEIGIPLHIVLRGIETAFDGFDSRPHPHRKINSIFYCQQAVESAFEEYRRSLVGSAEGGIPASDLDSADTPFPRDRVVEYLARAHKELEAAAHKADTVGIAEALVRAAERLAAIRTSVETEEGLSSENLERDLTSLEALVEKALAEHAPGDVVEAARKDAKKQLRTHKKAMDDAIYRQTLDRFVARSLREKYRVPRLSLFFMN